MRTLKEIALDLLNKYERAEEELIWECSGEIDVEIDALKKQVAKYKDEIERSNG